MKYIKSFNENQISDQLDEIIPLFDDIIDNYNLHDDNSIIHKGLSPSSYNSNTSHYHMHSIWSDDEKEDILFTFFMCFGIVIPDDVASEIFKINEDPVYMRKLSSSQYEEIFQKYNTDIHSEINSIIKRIESLGYQLITDYYIIWRARPVLFRIEIKISLN